VPPRVVLKQNTPNPFNPVTRVEFSVPTPRYVDVVVFDVSGRLVRRLYHGNAPVGYTVLTWTGDNERGEAVRSGVYFYQLSTSGERITRKMVLLK
jgi:flagellar hook assembly protein FlgD